MLSAYGHGQDISRHRRMTVMPTKLVIVCVMFGFYRYSALRVIYLIRTDFTYWEDFHHYTISIRGKLDSIFFTASKFLSSWWTCLHFFMWSDFRFLVPRDMTVGQFIHILGARLRLAPGKALFVFVKDTLPQTSSISILIFFLDFLSCLLLFFHLIYFNGSKHDRVLIQFI